MGDFNAIVKQQVEKKNKELEKISIQIEELKKTYRSILSDVRACNVLLGIEEPIQYKSMTKVCEEYKNIILTHFAQEKFTEGEIREKCIGLGFKIKGKDITDSYSRTIILNLMDSGFLERTSRGIYRIK